MVRSSYSVAASLEPGLPHQSNNPVYLVMFGIYGLMGLRAKQQATAARMIPYFGLMGVGICSGGYHMTLKYHTQMCMSEHLLNTMSIFRSGLHCVVLISSG